jgi:hypothetical protein
MSTTPFAGLAAKVKSQYATGKKSGALSFAESEEHDVDEEIEGTTIPVRPLSPSTKLAS